MLLKVVGSTVLDGVVAGALTVFLLLLGPAAGQVAADVALDPQGRVRLDGDFRLRFESDWSSARADGTRRDDRRRFRIRARLGLRLLPREGLVIGIRARSGSWASQQSPHVTVFDFDGGPLGNRDVVLDRWFVGFERSRTSLWIGRNSYPFWKQNELFWDDDVTLTGGALRQDIESGESKYSFIGGVFANADGMDRFHGKLFGAQFVVSRPTVGGHLTAASGVFLHVGDTGAENLRSGNGARDYSLWTGHAQARLGEGERRLTLGIDATYNFENYSPDTVESFTAAHADERHGVVASLLWGGMKYPGRWLLGYYYSRIEALAIHASYAQDDWVRWGSAGQTDSSDLEGHELRFALRVRKRMTVVMRLYLVKAISTGQDGKRFRVDWNLGF